MKYITFAQGNDDRIKVIRTYKITFHSLSHVNTQNLPSFDLKKICQGFFVCLI